MLLSDPYAMSPIDPPEVLPFTVTETELQTNVELQLLGLNLLDF